jgi:hypothetical protein
MPMRTGPTDHAPLPLDLTSPMQLALRLLLEAHLDAHALQRDVWEFALEYRTLTRAGVTARALRCLLSRGFVQHAVERIEPASARRNFAPLCNLALPEDASFILTAEGVAAAQRLGLGATDEADGGEAAFCQAVPRWDGARRELYFRGALVKRFRQPADCQEIILASFQEECWPPRIDNPLPPRPEQDVRQRLHDALNRLNRNQFRPLLRFRGDGTGEGLFWEPVSATGAPPEQPRGGT